VATIQIKRRTTAGTGPLTGSTGTIKAGEPLVDFNGEHLYIAKADKVGSVGTPLAESDYLKIPAVAKVDTQIDTKIAALGLGTAATKNTGVASGNVPILDASGKLADSIIPKVAITNTWSWQADGNARAVERAGRRRRRPHRSQQIHHPEDDRVFDARELAGVAHADGCGDQR
jgi:hypothetical protein